MTTTKSTVSLTGSIKKVFKPGMLVAPNEYSRSPGDFPVIMVHAVGNGDRGHLFSGIVVHSASHDAIGECSITMFIDKYTPFKGTVTLTSE